MSRDASSSSSPSARGSGSVTSTGLSSERGSGSSASVAAAAQPTGALADPQDEYWLKALEGEERVLRCGAVVKHVGLFSSKRRQLVLTSKPRLLYFDPSAKKLKGEIPWASTLRIERLSGGDWDVHTVRAVVCLCLCRRACCG